MGGFKVDGGDDETRGQQVIRQFAYILAQVFILRRATALKKEEDGKNETVARQARESRRCKRAAYHTAPVFFSFVMRPSSLPAALWSLTSWKGAGQD